MKVLKIDCKSERLKDILQVTKNCGVDDVDSLDHFLPQDKKGDYDLILLHVGKSQDEQTKDERKRALKYFDAMNVLCFSGSTEDLNEVRGWVRGNEKVWVLKQTFYTSYTDFNNTIEAQLVRQCIEMIKAGTPPLEIKNKIEGFNPDLEKALEDLYRRLRENKNNDEEIKKIRDDYFDSEMPAQ